MSVDTEALLLAVAQAREATGDDYLSLTLEFTVHDTIAARARWGCYTPTTGHGGKHLTPEAALAETVAHAADPDKLRKQAEHFEAEARRLRARVVEGGAK